MRKTIMLKQTFLACILMGLWSSTFASVSSPPKTMSGETKACVKCHQKNNPGIVQQWGRSKHYGANIGCYECHQADEGDIDAYIHDDKKVKKTI